jgi:hypothetical protein
VLFRLVTRNALGFRRVFFVLAGFLNPVNAELELDLPNPRAVKKLERADAKEHMMVRFDEEEPIGAPVSVRDRDGKSAASAVE